MGCDCKFCKDERVWLYRDSALKKKVAPARKVETGRGPVTLSLDLTPVGYRQQISGRVPTDVLSATKLFWNREIRGYRPRSNSDGNSATRRILIRGLYERSDLIKLQHKLWRHLLRKTVSKSEIMDALPDLPNYEEQPTSNIIGKFGLELEGGWDNRPRALRDDGSVNANSNYVGEVSTSPLSPVEYPWRREFFAKYPHKVDSSCGMHIHISFPSIGMYAAFADIRFTKWYVEGIRKWAVAHHLKSRRLNYRLDGRNSYCKIPTRRDRYEDEYGDRYDNWVAKQLSRNGDRYTAVNYCAWYKYKTMEIRVLPMFDMPRIGQKAVMETIRLVNLWGNAMGPVARKHVRLFEAKEKGNAAKEA